MKKVLSVMFFCLILCISVSCFADQKAEFTLYPFVPTITKSFNKTIDEWVPNGSDEPNELLFLASLVYDVNVAAQPKQIDFSTGEKVMIAWDTKSIDVYIPTAEFGLYINYFPNEEYSFFTPLYDYTIERAADEFMKYKFMAGGKLPWEIMLNDVYAQAVKINSQNSKNGQNNANDSDENYRELKPGCDGQDVLEARTKLYELGYFKNKPWQTEYTNNMMDYVKKFEKDYNLKQDGILSVEDQKVLFGK